MRMVIRDFIHQTKDRDTNVSVFLVAAAGFECHSCIRDIQVDSVNVDIGRNSPLRMHAIFSANLPNACAQLGEVRVQRDGTTFFLRLVLKSRSGLHTPRKDRMR